MDHQEWRGKVARLIGDATKMEYDKRRELNVLLEQITLKHAEPPVRAIPTICLQNVEPWPIVDIAGPVRWDSEGRLHIGVRVKKPNAQFNDDVDMVAQAKTWYTNQQPPLPKAEYETAKRLSDEVHQVRAQLKAREEAIESLQEQIEQLRTERNVMHNKLHDISNIVTSEK